MFTSFYTFLNGVRLSNVSLKVISNRLLTRSWSQLAAVKNSHNFNQPDLPTSCIYQHTFDSYQTMISKEKDDARNYVLIEDKTLKLKVTDKSSLELILDTPVTSYWEYWIKEKHYFLVNLTEFETFERQSQSFLANDKFPIKSKIYFLTELPSHDKSSESSQQFKNRCDIRLQRQFAKSIDQIGENESLDEKMRLLTYRIAQSELECKLKFFVINTLEDLLCQGVFNAFHLIPFGSSVNSLGWGSSGLDLCLTTKYESNPSSTLVPSTGGLLDGAVKRQRCIKMYTTLMKLDLIPGVSNVNQPSNNTLKLFSNLTATDITITCADPTTLELFKLSEILFEISRADERVFHLFHFCKLWAEVQGIISLTFNNLLLNMLIINYLQIRRPFPVLPPLEAFFKESEIQMEKSFIGDSKSSFNDILQEFFRHLGTFDFAHSGANLFLGKVVRKPTRDVLFVLDPAKGNNMAAKVTKNDLDNLSKNSLKSYKLLATGCHPQILLKPITQDMYRKLVK